jgi:hypothetical protein
MFIEFLSNDAVQTRQTAKGAMHKQNAYLHTDNPFDSGRKAYPLPFSIPLNSPMDAAPPGVFTLSAGAFRTNQYGDLELNRYAIVQSLIPVHASSDKKSQVA